MALAPRIPVPQQTRAPRRQTVPQQTRVPIPQKVPQRTRAPRLPRRTRHPLPPLLQQLSLVKGMNVNAIFIFLFLSGQSFSLCLLFLSPFLSLQSSLGNS